MKVIFSGGGTLGPVTPLLAMKEIIEEAHPHAEFLWVGTPHGPEKELIQAENIRFVTISSGKLRRYFSFLNIVDLFHFVSGFFQSLKLIWKENPDICISAGGFVSVPLHYAAAVLATPTWVHQQDVKVGLANRLMAPIATVITTATREEWNKFSPHKTFWMGNPIRKNIFLGDKQKAQEMFGLSGDVPVVFATGGGTGSLRVNQMVVEALPHLQGKCEVIHLTGRERPQEAMVRAAQHSKQYHPYQFFTDEMKHAYAVADIVVSRGGFGTLTELAALKKASILIPKEGHQVENVVFLQQAQAVIMLDERTDNGLVLAKIIQDLLTNKSQRQRLEQNLYEVLPPATKERVLKVLTQAVKS